MRMLLLAVLGLCGASAAAAHDFWVQPAQYWPRPDTVVPVTLQVGHGPSRQRSPIRSSRITRFAAIAPGGATLNLRNNLHPGDTKDDGALRFQAPGVYVLILETDDHAQSYLPAIRFNDYLRVEGLTPALQQRERTHRLDTDGSESYRRCSKAIVQVGTADRDIQAQVVTPVGLPLEIVPEVNPYTQPRPAQLPVRVIYEGRPLAGALIKLTDLNHDDAPLETHLTDRTGHASFTMPDRGQWLLNVIWTKPLPSSRETDFQTVFSSLSFGLPSRGLP
jgi:uncharacterized GH25 family protein